MCAYNCRFKVILSLFLLMCMPWSVGVIVCVARNNIDYEILRTFNILWPIFIFIIFVCKPSVWKMLKLKFPWISPFLLTCEKLGSKIICMKSKHQPLVTVTRNQLNSINMAGISGKFTQIGYQRHTESTVWNKHASNTSTCDIHCKKFRKNDEYIIRLSMRMLWKVDIDLKTTSLMQ
jgi:hypothetical protein